MSIAASSSATTRNTWSFLSLRKRFLVWPPAISPRSDWLSSTVKSGGCSAVVVLIPNRSRVAKRSARDAGIGMCQGEKVETGGRLSGSDERRQPQPGPPARGPLVAIRGALRHIRAGAGTSRRLPFCCGCSSGVEHNLAKVGVEGSNPFARSKFSKYLQGGAAAIRNESDVCNKSAGFQRHLQLRTTLCSH